MDARLRFAVEERGLDEELGTAVIGPATTPEVYASDNLGMLGLFFAKLNVRDMMPRFTLGSSCLSTLTDSAGAVDEELADILNGSCARKECMLLAAVRLECVLGGLLLLRRGAIADVRTGVVEDRMSGLREMVEETRRDEGREGDFGKDCGGFAIMMVMIWGLPTEVKAITFAVSSALRFVLCMLAGIRYHVSIKRRRGNCVRYLKLSCSSVSRMLSSYSLMLSESSLER